jgi:hypothetical protein
MSDESPERRAVGEQDGKMIETEQPALWNSASATQLAKVDDLPILIERTESG